MFLLQRRLTSHLWCLDFVRDFLKKYYFFGVLNYFGLIMLIESCKISKLVMHLNSCSMDLGCDSVGIDPRKSASHICAIPLKDQSLLRLLVVVNKAQIYPVNTRCGTHHTPTQITQSIKLGYHTVNMVKFNASIFYFFGFLRLSSGWITNSTQFEMN